MMPSQALQQAAEAINAGQKQTAQAILARIIKDSPRNEIAWLYLAHTVDSCDKQKDCLRKVLAVNPNNPVARSMLAMLEEDAQARLPFSAPVDDDVLTLSQAAACGKQITSPSTPIPEHVPAFTEDITLLLDRDSTQHKTRRKPILDPRNMTRMLVGTGTGLICGLFVMAYAYTEGIFFLSSKVNSWALVWAVVIMLLLIFAGALMGFVSTFTSDTRRGTARAGRADPLRQQFTGWAGSHSSKPSGTD